MPKLLTLSLLFLFAFTPYLNISFMPPTSPGIRGLSIVGLCMISLLLFTNSRVHVQLSRFAWVAIGVWSAVSIIGLYGSTNPAAALVRQTEWFCGLVLFFLIGSIGKPNLQTLTKYFLVALTFAGLLFVAVFVVVWNQLSDPNSHNWFSSPFPFGHIRFYGYIAMCAALAGLYLLDARPSKRISNLVWHIGSGSIVLLLIAGVFWSGGRGAIVGLLCGLIAILCSVQVAKLRVLLITLMIAVPAAFFLAQWATPSPEQAVSGPQMLGPSIDHNVSAGNLDSFSSGRLGIWNFTYSRLMEQPWIGYGANGYDSLSGKSVHTGQPHSLILQSLTDWGIVGGSIFLLAIFSISAKRFASAVRSKLSMHQSIVLSIVGALLAHGLVDGTLYHQPSTSVFLLAFPIMYWQSASTNPGHALRYSSLIMGSTICVLLLIGSLHLLNIRNQLSNAIPLPNSSQAKLIRLFPSDTSNVRRWISEWYKDDPETAFEWTRWMQSHSERPWNYYLLEEQLLREQGDHESADMVLLKLDEIRPAWSWEEFGREWGVDFN